MDAGQSVINSLNACVRGEEGSCANCLHNTSSMNTSQCMRKLMADAASLLLEYQKRLTQNDKSNIAIPTNVFMGNQKFNIGVNIMDNSDLIRNAQELCEKANEELNGNLAMPSLSVSAYNDLPDTMSPNLRKLLSLANKYTPELLEIIAAKDATIDTLGNMVNSYCESNKEVKHSCAKEVAWYEKRIKELTARAEQAEAERNAAIEDIKHPSVCERCKNKCQGDDECIDNGYMYFDWRGLNG